MIRIANAAWWTPVCALLVLSASTAQAASKSAPRAGTVLTAGNDYLQIHMQTTAGDGLGEFTVTTPTGTVLYGNGQPGTSYMTIHSYTSGVDYVQGVGLCGMSLDGYGTVVPIDGGFRVVYKLPGAPVTPDQLTIQQDIVVSGDDAADSRVNVTTTVLDNGVSPVQIGVRYLWDYDVDGDDAPVLSLSPSSRTSNEATLAKPGAVVIASDGSSAASPAVDSAVEPDSVAYVAWPAAHAAPFDYVPTPSTSAAQDSALLTYFGSNSAIQIGPGQAISAAAAITAAVEKEDKVTITVSPKVAAVGQEITITAKESGPPDGDKVSWKASGGTPDSGKGWTFKTSYKSPGKKTIEIKGLADDGAPPSVTVSVIKVAFDIDGETDPKKALCFVKNTVGVIEDGAAVKPLRLRTPCHVWVEGSPDADVKVVLKNPDTKLLFTKQLAATTKLTLPANGDKIGFLLYGEKQSAAIGDAKVEAHLDDKTDQLLGDQKVTVFYFEPSLTIASDGLFSVIDGKWTTKKGDTAVEITYGAKAKPDTVDITAGVLGDIDLGVAQNNLSVNRLFEEDKPLVKWAPNIKAGTKATVPKTLTRQMKSTEATNDTVAATDPLFRPRLVRPNAAAVKSWAFASMLATMFDVSVKDPDNNEIVGTAIYSLKGRSFDDHWRTWCVAYKKDSKAEFPLQEGTWDLKFTDTTAAADQKATTGGASVAAANAPIRGLPFFRDSNKNTTVQGANITLEQPGVESVTLAAASVKGGTATTATVELTAPAGYGGTRVNLSSDKPAAAKPDGASVVVPAGKTTVDFDIDTFAVAADQNVRISASCHDKEANARLKVTK